MHRSAAVSLFAVIVALASIWPTPAGAVEQPALDAQALDRSIDEVLQRRQYQWRMPRTEPAGEEAEEPGAIRSFFKWLGKKFAGAIEYAAEMLRKFIEWLESLFPRSSPSPDPAAAGWMTPVRIMLTAASLAVAAGLIYAIWKLLGVRRRQPAEPAGASVSTAPDLAAEEISAGELPAERWQTLAQEMWQQGELRLAMRAFYLATLAGLADRRLVLIESSKSNLEYKRELDRRARERPELPAAFADAVLRFEKIWYGLKSISGSEVHDFEKLYQRIVGMADAWNEPGGRGAAQPEDLGA